MNPPLNVKINTHGGPLPETHGDWTDLFTAEEINMEAGEYRQIPLGVSMKLPEGYYAIVAPRSSTFKRWGILMANSIGIVDSDYCGDDDIWAFPAYATRPTRIPKGTRIAQFKIFPRWPMIAFQQVDELGNPNRGGFGSTGGR